MRRTRVPAADGQRSGGSLQDVAFGQCLLEFLDSGVRHLRAGQVEVIAVPEWGELLEPDVCHLRVVQIEPTDVREWCELLEPGVCHLRA